MGKRKVAALDLGALQVVEIDEAGVQFQTGVPVTMRYIRNVQPAPYFGDRFQQDIEPAGRYLMHLHWDPGQRAAEQGWEVGEVTLHAPLVLSFTTDGPEAPTLYGPGSWKARLHQALSASGCKLTKALRTAGFDSIVTVWLQGGEPSHTKEIVLLPEKCADKVRSKRNPSHDGYGRLPTQSRTATGDTMFANPSKAMVFGELEVRKEKGRTFGVWHMLLNDWVIQGLPQESAMDAAALFSGEEGEELLLRLIGDDSTAKAEIERMQDSPHVIPKRLNLDKELVIPYKTDAKGKWNDRAPERKAKIAVVRRYGDWVVHRRPNFEVPIDDQGFVQTYVDDGTYVVAYKDGRSARVGLKRDTAYLLAEQLDGPWANMASELVGGQPSQEVAEELSRLISDLVVHPAKYRKPKKEVEPKEVEDWIEIENTVSGMVKTGKLIVERRFGNWVVTRAINFYAPQDERGFFKPGKGYDVRYKDGRTLQVSLPKATAYLLARHMNGPWSEVGDMLVGITGHDSEKVSEVAMHVRALIKDPKSYKL